jgi:hypothetical protein
MTKDELNFLEADTWNELSINPESISAQDKARLIVEVRKCWHRIQELEKERSNADDNPLPHQ